MSTFIYPESAIQNKPHSVLTTKQINQWRNNGFVLVNDIIPQNMLASAVKEASLMLKDFDTDDFGGLEVK